MSEIVCGEVGTWKYEFGKAHNRCPDAQDRRDRDWSLAFLAEHERPPTDAEWLVHWEQGNEEEPSEIEDLTLQVERLERTVAGLQVERAELSGIIDAVKALLFEVIVLPKLGN